MTPRRLWGGGRVSCAVGREVLSRGGVERGWAKDRASVARWVSQSGGAPARFLGATHCGCFPCIRLPRANPVCLGGRMSPRLTLLSEKEGGGGIGSQQRRPRVGRPPPPQKKKVHTAAPAHASRYDGVVGAVVCRWNDVRSQTSRQQVATVRRAALDLVPPTLLPGVPRSSQNGTYVAKKDAPCRPTLL